MNKLLFALLLLFCLTFKVQGQNTNFDFKVKSQVTHAVDLSVLTATTVYWVYGEKVQPDKVIHFLFGYFSTQAMYYILEPLDLPRSLKISTPVLVFGGLAAFKEVFLDGKADWVDFKAGMYGCAISVISFNIVYSF